MSEDLIKRYGLPMMLQPDPYGSFGLSWRYLLPAPYGLLILSAEYLLP